MLTKSELIVCSTAAIALVAYSAGHHVDPAVVTRELASTVMQATIYGLKTGAHFLYQTGKASAIVFGSYAALKIAVVTGKAIKNKVRQRFAVPLYEESEDELSSEEEGLQEEIQPEDEVHLSLDEIETVEPNFTISSWNEAKYEETEDEDYEDDEELDVIVQIAEEDALTSEEINLLLGDQKRVFFHHRATILSPLLLIENTHLKGPYRLRPR